MPNLFKSEYGDVFRFIGIVSKALSADDLEVVNNNQEQAVSAIRRALANLQNQPNTCDQKGRQPDLFRSYHGDVHRMCGILAKGLRGEELDLILARPDETMAAVRSALRELRTALPQLFEKVNVMMRFPAKPGSLPKREQALSALGGHPDQWLGGLLDGHLNGNEILCHSPSEPRELELRFYQGRKYRLASVLEEIAKEPDYTTATLIELSTVIGSIPRQYQLLGVVATGSFLIGHGQPGISVVSYHGARGLEALPTEESRGGMIGILVAKVD